MHRLRSIERQEGGRVRALSGGQKVRARDVLGIPESVVLDVMRCWQAARTGRVARQPCLYRTLARHRLEILAPVFDSLMTICETVMKRTLTVGVDRYPSVDETMLIDMLVDPGDARNYVSCPEERFTLLECALRSTRLMMEHALAGISPRRHRQH